MLLSRRAILLAPFAAIQLEDWVAADGSSFPHSSWRIEDGCLKSIGGLPTFQDIKTVKLYDDFEFSFDWRMSKAGNSGVKYQLERWDKWQPKGLEGFHIRARGPELQLVDDNDNPDAQIGPLKQCGSLYNTIPAAHKAKFRVDEFNTARLTKRGLKVEHWINEALLVSYNLKECHPSAIALQNHACDVWFRNLKITALPAAQTPHTPLR